MITCWSGLAGLHGLFGFYMSLSAASLSSSMRHYLVQSTRSKSILVWRVCPSLHPPSGMFLPLRKPKKKRPCHLLFPLPPFQERILSTVSPSPTPPLFSCLLILTVNCQRSPIMKSITNWMPTTNRETGSVTPPRGKNTSARSWQSEFNCQGSCLSCRRCCKHPLYNLPGQSCKTNS